MIKVSGAAPSDPGSLFRVQDNAGAAATDLKGTLAGHLGEEFSVRFLETLGPEKFLIEIAGAEVVAQGAVPSASVEGLWVARLESLEPLIRFRLLGADSGAVPETWRRLLGEVVNRPNFFSERILSLQRLLQADSGLLSPSLSKALASLVERFSAGGLLAGLRSGTGLPLEQLGLFYEQQLAQLLILDPRSFMRHDLQSPRNLKELLLRLLMDLRQEPAETASLVMAKRAALVTELAGVLRSLLDLVELNQFLNNPGLRREPGLFLLLPLLGWGSEADLWLRLSRERQSPGAETTPACSLMIYLNMDSLGPIGAFLCAGNDGLQGKIMVVGESAARSLRSLLPECRRELGDCFARGVGLVVEEVGMSGVEEFRRRAFLATLPALFQASG
ncbi:MAG: hypothetical protein JXR89_11145 [Deltaproteobacteria bacterium]|nr:hypothetical protein [Deltaproteobacteria bacterium]